MKSTAITRGLLIALSGLAHFSAAAAASADPEEKTLGDQLSAIDLTAHTAQLADVKAPELPTLLDVHAKVVAMVGSDEGLIGGLDAIALNATRKGAAAATDKMTQVNALLARAVDPPKGEPRKLTPAQAAAQRQAYVKNPDKPLADLQAFIRLAEPLIALNTSEDEGAATSGDGSGSDASQLDDDFEASMAAAGAAHKIGGGK